MKTHILLIAFLLGITTAKAQDDPFHFKDTIIPTNQSWGMGPKGTMTFTLEHSYDSVLFLDYIHFPVLKDEREATLFINGIMVRSAGEDIDSILNLADTITVFNISPISRVDFYLKLYGLNKKVPDDTGTISANIKLYNRYAPSYTMKFPNNYDSTLVIEYVDMKENGSSFAKFSINDELVYDNGTIVNNRIKPSQTLKFISETEGWYRFDIKISGLYKTVKDTTTGLSDWNIPGFKIHNYDGKLVLENSDVPKEFNIEIHNVIGQLLKKRTDLISGKKEFDPQLPPGIYTILIEHNGRKMIQKISLN